MKCSKCKKGFTKADMVTNRLCKTCYLEVNAYTDISTEFVLPEPVDACVKCRECGKWHCGPSEKCK